MTLGPWSIETARIGGEAEDRRRSRRAEPGGPGITASAAFWSRAALTKSLLWWRSD